MGPSVPAMRWAWIFLAGGVGALLRFGLSTTVQIRAGDAFPWGTLSVNAIGCFAIGLLATLFEERGASTELKTLLIVAG